MKKFLVNRTREDGFTLIELLVVVIIIAILAAVAVPVYIGIQNNAKKSSIQSDVATTKLNVASILTEDGTVNSGTTTAAVGATVQNSKSPDDEVVTVTVDPATKQYKVVGSSAKLDYAATYDSSTGQQKTGTAAAAAPVVAAPVVVSSWDFTPTGPGGNQGWNFSSSAGGAEGMTIIGDSNSTFAPSSVSQTTVVGKTYTFSAKVQKANANSAIEQVCVFSYSDTSTQVCATPVNAGPNNLQTVSFTFTATGTNTFIGLRQYYPMGTPDTKTFLTFASAQLTTTN